MVQFHIVYFCGVDSCTERGSVYRSGDDQMENRCLIRLSRRSFPISQWLVWQDFSCVPDICFTEIIPGGKCWKNTRRGLWDLLIPYVIWTLLYYFIHVGVSYITPLRAVFNEPPITVTWKGIVDAVLNYRYCAFLWFLQFLILFVVISPLIYLLISNRYMGIVAIVLVLVIDSTGICGDLAFGSVQAQAFCNWLFIYMTGWIYRNSRKQCSRK